MLSVQPGSNAMSCMSSLKNQGMPLILCTCQIEPHAGMHSICMQYVQLSNAQLTTEAKCSEATPEPWQFMSSRLTRHSAPAWWELIPLLHACMHAQIDVAITAKADIAWMWGFQGAVEGLFISQAKDDIAAFFDFIKRIFADLTAAGKAGHLITPFSCTVPLCYYINKTPDYITPVDCRPDKNARTCPKTLQHVGDLARKRCCQCMDACMQAPSQIAAAAEAAKAPVLRQLAAAAEAEAAASLRAKRGTRPRTSRDVQRVGASSDVLLPVVWQEQQQPTRRVRLHVGDGSGRLIDHSGVAEAAGKCCRDAHIDVWQVCSEVAYDNTDLKAAVVAVPGRAVMPYRVGTA